MRNYARALICLFSIITFSYSLDANRSYFGMLNLSFHDRSGILDLGNNHQQMSNRPLLKTLGVSLGKNFALPLHFRLALPLVFDYGYVTDASDSMLLTNGVVSNVNLISVFNQIGISPELQYVLPVSGHLNIFLSVGGGIHYANFKQEERLADDNSIRVIDTYPENYSGVRMSCCAGAGTELILNKRKAIAFRYLFRYWNPVNGESRHDLFPYDAVGYKERFLTHSFSVIYLINL
jgi:hypothetical protein